MIKISKITDYGIVILSHLARQQTQMNETGTVWTAKELAKNTHIPLPTVGKILKQFSKAGILGSIRGSLGGYSLLRPPEDLSVALVIKTMEGEVAMTDCSEKGNHTCCIQTSCVNKSNWQKINRAVYSALENLSVADMSRPLPQAWPLFERVEDGRK